MTWDKITDDRIKTLHPLIRDEVEEIIKSAMHELGIFLRITQALRSFTEQNELYAQGRSKPGKIVTNAKGGSSWHNYGLAFDVVEIQNGKAIWDTKYDKIAAIAHRYGFDWGGHFTSIVDKPHFQKTFGLTIAQARAMYDALPKGQVYINIKIK